MPGLTMQSGTVPLAYENRKLRSTELPATQFLVPDRVPYGLWLHSAPAGGYKSAFAAQIEHHIAYSTPIPGLDWQFAQHGDCLVISPDESAYEMQDRTLRILPGGQLETDGLDDYPNQYYDIHVRHDPHGANLDQRIAWLYHEIETIESITSRHIVWIRWDTIGNLLGDRAGVDHYTHAMPLQKLNATMANSHRVMYMPNHLGKNGESIGSVNLTACSNISTKASITRNSNEGVITCLDEGTKMRGGRGWSAALKLKNGLLELTDESPQEAGHALDSQPRILAAYLAKHGGATVAELREGTGLGDKVLWKCILRLRAKNEVWNDAGNWKLIETGSVSRWPDNWRPCDVCNSAVDPKRGCCNVRCERFSAAAWGDAPADGSPAATGDIERSVDWQERVDRIVESQWYGKPSPAPIEVPAVQMTPFVPQQRAAAEPEPVPRIGGNEFVDKLIELVKTSPLYAERKLNPEIRAQMPYEKTCVGGSPNRYQFWPKERPDGRILILDRRAAYYQSCVAWTAPNVLHREGNLDYGDVVRKSFAGMFEMLYTPWENETYPDPLGSKFRKGQRLLVPRATLDRVMESVKAGHRQEPEILFGLIGKGSERGPLYHFGRHCLDVRRTLAGDQLAAAKEAQNQAFGTLRIVDEDKNAGPVDRPDWQYAAVGHHYAQINRYVWKSLDAGEPVIASGNTDEICYRIPDGESDLWLPDTMRAHIAAGRFSVKRVVKAEIWYENPRALDA